MRHVAAVRRVFPPDVATYLTKLACELPDAAGRSLSLWTCAELARAVEKDGIVATISPQSVQRILGSFRLKPWRVHYWLTPKGPLDEEFRRRVEDLCELYTRSLESHERVLCLDEKTSIQPRPRRAETRPAAPDLAPVRLEHEYVRAGAVALLAAFDVRTGGVLGICRRRKRQIEFIELLEEIDRTTPASVTVLHIVCDNVSTHHGKRVRAWLGRHPRFQMHFTPVHCSWMNQVEQWFSILQRKRLAAPRFDDLADLETKIAAFIAEWNEIAHPFDWKRESFRKVLDRVEAAIAKAA
jgi:transposase